MPEPFESVVTQRLDEQTLCVMALWKREDGSIAIIGMRDIIAGEFVSSRFLNQVDDNKISAEDEFEEREVSRMAATGGELFVINRVNLDKTAEELRELLISFTKDDEA